MDGNVVGPELGAPSETVDAVEFERFGGPEQLLVRRVVVPPPRRGQVRVRMHAASINPIDGKIRRGEMRWMSGSKLPMRVGSEIAGVVEALGPEVRELAVGDRVFGFGALGAGTFAEAVVVDASALVKLDPRISFADAAAGLVGVTALQALRLARVGRGTRLLVTGATGGVGALLLQLARRASAHVTAVGTTRGVQLALELGATEALDYRAVDIVGRGGTYDVIVDLAGALRFERARALLAPRGVLVDPVPTPARLVGQSIANLFRRQKWRALLTKPLRTDIEETARLLASGELRVVIDRTFALSEIVEAYRHAERGGSVGKVLVRLGGA
jgi:NADPH:quinone reductase-like Zn-dependent oxidoreductase